MDPVVSTLTPPAQARISQSQRHWAPPGEHPLAALHGAGIGPDRLIALLGPKSSVGSQSFQLLLADPDGELSEIPLALGLFNRGPYPAFNWIELTRYDSALALGAGEIDLRAEGLEPEFFAALSELVPPGGHMMVEYDSPSQRPTAWTLTLGYPEACSPTGYLMFQAGCRSYKNWHISEGGREGPRKLQGFKPWNDDIRRQKTERLREEILRFQSTGGNPQHGEWGQIARANAAAILAALTTEL